MRQIIAMGGGGFTMEPGNPLLDDYVLSQSPVKKPKICFLPTAGNDNMELIEDFYDFFMTRDCLPAHLSLSNPAIRDLKGFLLDQHIIYVGGGHTGHMLSAWKACGVDVILKKAWQKGILLAGVSAGASCWFEMGLTDSVPDRLSGEPCLGFLSGSHCAHYENTGRRPIFHRLISEGRLPAGIGTENFAALHFIGADLKKVVASRPGAAAYIIRKTPDGIVEQKHPGILLELTS
ncbi:MAG: type 1 glutamine amidotransferase-like domain-containing protein [bacterium]|nr:type 1 glutamine amidotransferase-like domain-containing protein [bacterium]